VTQRSELADQVTVREAVIDPLVASAEHEWAAEVVLS
jgi:hypothetical protein